MKTTNKSFADNLRKEIKRKHLTYAAAAELFDISLPFLNNIMRGENGPSLEVLYKIVETLGITSDALLFGDATPISKPDIDPAAFTSVAQIAAALTDMNKRMAEISSKSSPTSLVAGITTKLAPLDDGKLGIVSRFIDNLIEHVDGPSEVAGTAKKAL